MQHSFKNITYFVTTNLRELVDISIADDIVSDKKFLNLQQLSCISNSYHMIAFKIQHIALVHSNH